MATATALPQVSPAPESKSNAELRKQKRLPLSGLVLVVWRDEQKQIKSMYAMLRNISSGGALLQCYRPLPVGTPIRVRSRKLFFVAGCALVQHCARRGLFCQIGVKFYEPLGRRF